MDLQSVLSMVTTGRSMVSIFLFCSTIGAVDRCFCGSAYQFDSAHLDVLIVPFIYISLFRSTNSNCTSELVV